MLRARHKRLGNRTCRTYAHLRPLWYCKMLRLLPVTGPQPGYRRLRSQTHFERLRHSRRARNTACIHAAHAPVDRAARR